MIERIPPALINERFGQARLAASLARATLGLTLGQVGQFDDAVVRVQEGLQIAEAARFWLEQAEAEMRELA